MSLLLCALSAGIVFALWQDRLPAQAALWGGLLAGILLVVSLPLVPGTGRRLGLAPRQRRPLAALVLLGAAVAGGYAWGCRAADARLQAALSGSPAARVLQFEGWISDLPQPTASGARITFDLAPAARAAGLPARVMLAVTAAQRHPGDGLAGGACLAISARLQPVHAPLNFAGFDGEGWLWSLGVGATGRLLAWQPCSRFRAPLLARVEQTREQIRQALLAVLGERSAAGIVVALAVGDQSGVSQSQWTLLWRSGIGHLVSISGVHVTLLASVLRRLGERGWRRVPAACRLWPASHAGAVLGLLAALAYALLAGFAVPARRTLFMLAAGVACATWHCRPDGPRVFWMAVVATLASDPWACLSPSFWLSFAAIGGLILADHGRQPERPHWQAELAAQWVSTLTLLPMIALWFGQISLVAPLANLVAIPLVGLVVTPLALAAMFPGLHGLAIPAERLLECLLQGLDWLAAPDWAAFDVPVPGPLALALAVAAVPVLLLGRPRLPDAPWAALALLPLLLPPNPLTEGSLRVEVVDVGQGLSVLLRTRRHLLVFDTGPRWPGGDTGARTLVPLLRAEGLGPIDRLVLSHPDADHVGGADSLLAVFPAARVQAGFRRSGAQDCVAGERWRWDGVDFTFLYPPGPARAGVDAHERNNHACVLRASAGAHAVLLTADIEASAERALTLAAGAEQLRSDVVVVPHHGSRTSSTPALIAASGAQWALISLGWQNRYHHPDPGVVARWQAAGARVLRTDLEGALRVDLSPDGVRVESARQMRGAWWRSGKGLHSQDARALPTEGAP